MHAIPPPPPAPCARTFVGTKSVAARDIGRENTFATLMPRRAKQERHLKIAAGSLRTAMATDVFARTPCGGSLAFAFAAITTNRVWLCASLEMPSRITARPCAAAAVGVAIAAEGSEPAATAATAALVLFASSR